MIFKWLKFLSLFFPDLTGFKELGFKVKTGNGELIVEKVEELYSIKFSQGFEPFNPHLTVEVDFDIPDGFFLIEFFHEVPSLPLYKDDLEGLF